LVAGLGRLQRGRSDANELRAMDAVACASGAARGERVGGACCEERMLGSAVVAGGRLGAAETRARHLCLLSWCGNV